MIVLSFGGEERTFSLDKIKHTSMLEREIQKFTNECSIYDIYGRLATMRPSSADIYHTIRVALIGGGMDPAKVAEVLRDYVEGCSFEGESGPRNTALAIVASRIEEVRETTKDLPDGDASKKTGAAG